MRILPLIIVVWHWAARHAKEHVAVDIGVRERGEGLVVHHDHIRCRAGSQNSQSGEAGSCRHLRVVMEEHVSDLAPSYPRQTGIVPLGTQGHLYALQHVVGIGISAHAREDALLIELQNWGDADSIAHVGLWVVDTHRVCCLNDVHFSTVHVDAVAQDGLFSQNAVILEPLDGLRP